jgi:hypothetical protein
MRAVISAANGRTEPVRFLAIRIAVNTVGALLLEPAPWTPHFTAPALAFRAVT